MTAPTNCLPSPCFGCGVVTYTHPEVFEAAARGESWADPIADPTLIDWQERGAPPLIPFKIDQYGPVNPVESTGIRYGRGRLGHWGEQRCADALVTATDPDGHRWIVMIERKGGDGTSGWALPGGYVDPDETPAGAAVRELREETGLVLPGVVWEQAAPRYVPDPRATDQAWMVSVLSRTYLGCFHRYRLPLLAAGDDAKRAAWVLADSYEDMTRHLAEAYGGQVFTAHRPLLADALNDQPTKGGNTCSSCGKAEAREAIPGSGLYLCDDCISEADRN